MIFCSRSNIRIRQFDELGANLKQAEDIQSLAKSKRYGGLAGGAGQVGRSKPYAKAPRLEIS
jgi:hypothetical protein